MTTRLIDEQFPAYAQVIPKASGTVFSMKVGAVDETIGDDVQRAVTVRALETTHHGDDHVQGFIIWYLVDAIADLDTVALFRFFKAEDPLGDRTAVVMPWRL